MNLYRYPAIESYLCQIEAISPQTLWLSVGAREMADPDEMTHALRSVAVGGVVLTPTSLWGDYRGSVAGSASGTDKFASLEEEANEVANVIERLTSSQEITISVPVLPGLGDGDQLVRYCRIVNAIVSSPAGLLFQIPDRLAAVPDLVNNLLSHGLGLHFPDLSTVEHLFYYAEGILAGVDSLTRTGFASPIRFGYNPGRLDRNVDRSLESLLLPENSGVAPEDALGHQGQAGIATVRLAIEALSEYSRLTDARVCCDTKVYDSQYPETFYLFELLNDDCDKLVTLKTLQALLLPGIIHRSSYPSVQEASESLRRIDSLLRHNPTLLRRR